MEVSVWDSYVRRSDGSIMHFDILVPSELTDEAQVFAYGKAYLRGKPFKTADFSARECTFCHIEYVTDDIADQIGKEGFFILELENCD